MTAERPTSEQSSYPCWARAADRRRYELRRWWLVCRRYLSAESMALLDAANGRDDETENNEREEVMELNAA